MTCQHLAEAQLELPSAPHECPDCVVGGDRWVHLRRCMLCGHVGCCDSSPNRHARRHFHETSHPIIASHEPDEDWLWCYADETYLERAAE